MAYTFPWSWRINVTIETPKLRQSLQLIPTDVYNCIRQDKKELHKFHCDCYYEKLIVLCSTGAISRESRLVIW